MKAQDSADHLAENPVNGDYEPLDTYFSDEEINSVEEVDLEENQVWKLYFDGAINAKGTRIGAILLSPTGKHYLATARLCFFCTNNTTEYEACIMGLNMAINWGVKELIVKRFRSIEFRYIPRFCNELADGLATLASMLPYPGNSYITPLEIQVRDRHGYCNTVEAEPDSEPWYLDIKQFFKTRKCPEHANGSQKKNY
ncbi:hypothetical protein R3W88_014863 [Solanum pinnatisectum]|uniref:RNase H type-1 domain-containing protein n=1 Tax=Solanum pinnatisectum TaxID=50273 RepID=A0AAV9KVY5_9SOLN|nr:hypothetical protein R3W88_014863 [Solanum pinnatisectum]